MYLAQAIDQVLEDKKSKLLGRPTYYQIAGTLTRGYKKADIPFKFRFETFDDYGPDDFSVSGLYDMEEDVKYIYSTSQKNKENLISQMKFGEILNSLCLKFVSTKQFTNYNGRTERKTESLVQSISVT